MSWAGYACRRPIEAGGAARTATGYLVSRPPSELGDGARPAPRGSRLPAEVHQGVGGVVEHHHLEAAVGGLDQGGDTEVATLPERGARLGPGEAFGPVVAVIVGQPAV